MYYRAMIESIADRCYDGETLDLDSRYADGMLTLAADLFAAPYIETGQRMDEIREHVRAYHDEEQVNRNLHALGLRLRPNDSSEE